MVASAGDFMRALQLQSLCSGPQFICAFPWGRAPLNVQEHLHAWPGRGSREFSKSGAHILLTGDLGCMEAWNIWKTHAE